MGFLQNLTVGGRHLTSHLRLIPSDTFKCPVYLFWYVKSQFLIVSAENEHFVLSNQQKLKPWSITKPIFLYVEYSKL